MTLNRGGRKRCSACALDDARLAELNRELVGGERSLRALALVYGMTHPALSAHRKNHLSRTLAALRTAGTGTVMEQFQRLVASAQRQLETAERAGNSATALGAIREARETLVIIAKASGSMKPEPVVIDYATLPAAVEVRVAMMRALSRFPEAQIAVAEALAELEGE